MSKERRRQYGTGSVYQQADGKWRGVLQLGWTERGTRRVATVSAATEAECKRRLTRKGKQLEEGADPAAAAHTTVKQWAEQWLAHRLTQVRPKTAANYASQVKRWIIPTIGHKRLDRLTPGDIRSVASAIRDAGRSSTTARTVHTILTKMLRDALADGHPIAPRLLVVSPPARAVSDRDAIPSDIARALLVRAAADPDGSRWVAALLQGMRQGECLGLTWHCVDLDAGVLDVSWQLQALQRTDAWSRNAPLRVPDGYEYKVLDGTLCLVRPKTARGQRLIPLVPWMTAALRAWKAIAPPSPHGLVWPRPDGRPQTSAADLAAWKGLQQAPIAVHPAGRYWHLHEARHTTATLLLEAGVDPQTVTAILGHSSITTSRGYQHVSQALARQAMEAVAEKLGLPAAVASP